MVAYYNNNPHTGKQRTKIRTKRKKNKKKSKLTSSDIVSDTYGRSTTAYEGTKIVHYFFLGKTGGRHNRAAQAAIRCCVYACVEGDRLFSFNNNTHMSKGDDKQ